MSDTPAEMRFRVSGMDCGSCASKIDTAVRRMPGVGDVSVSYPAESLTVRHDGSVEEDAVMRQVKQLGFGAAPVSPGGARTAAPADTPVATPWWQARKTRATLACAAALVLAYAVGHLFPAAERIAFLLALLVGLVPVAHRAFAAARFGTPFSIEMLMTVAAVGAVAIGATEEAAAVVLFFLIGEMLEGLAASRARSSISALGDLVPKTAFVEEDGETREIDARALEVGMVILVRPGDRIAADGEVVEGTGDVDEAPVTGESVPKQKGIKDPVFAGTINASGVLRVKVTATSADNTIARIVRLVEEAQEAKAPTERFIDRFSKVYTPFVVVVAALFALVPPLLFGGDWSEWIYKGLALLLIGCPCALVISTPAAVAASLASGARRGLLLKGGAVLEGLRDLTAIAFDKTGTLTEGKPKVTDVVAFSRTRTVVLSMSAALERGSSHPLALAILEAAGAEKAPIPPAFMAEAVAGEGITGNIGGEAAFFGSPRAAATRAPLAPDRMAAIEALNAQGKTVSVLVVRGEAIGLVALRDEARPDAAAGLARLSSLGIQTLMLTGDNRRTAEAIGAGIGIEVRAELMPEDKQRIVRELQGNGKKVGKVGDGINDAPALAAADIGIAMGGGTDVALETADAAVLHGRVSDVADLVALSRATMRNIHVNIAIALGLKAVFLVTTVVGITGLWPAILADTGATVLVTANAMRLLRWRPR
ncbi:heavy metal translocating P-type ATPase [Jiella pacifica]|uniref:P-type Zn(2+) transporter n=1 Tax=Jiella pacifica TaxID=2696469 RepID=A0A6N9TFK7_9HYPH|nr:heavy metal translocating P-type ATPase [Jiella pacifica]NDW07648.1 cadmium-translocating P-type ATPase [Jiella pacifica]